MKNKGKHISALKVCDRTCVTDTGVTDTGVITDLDDSTK